MEQTSLHHAHSEAEIIQELEEEATDTPTGLTSKWASPPTFHALPRRKEVWLTIKIRHHTVQANSVKSAFKSKETAW